MYTTWDWTEDDWKKMKYDFTGLACLAQCDTFLIISQIATIQFVLHYIYYVILKSGVRLDKYLILKGPQ